VRKFHPPVILVLVAAVASSAYADKATVLVQDVTSLEANENPLIGYGLVVGLAGTGDSEDLEVTRRSLTNLLSRFNPALASNTLKGSKNTAVVVVSATLPPFHAVGSKIDVHVASIGDAQDLKGGQLIETPLTGPDFSTVYAVARGQLRVPEGGPQTRAVIRKGGMVTDALPSDLSRLVEDGRIKLIVDPKYASNVSLANQVAEAVNAELNPPGETVEEYARVISPSVVEITIPPEFENYASFIGTIRQLPIRGQANEIKARVIINDTAQTIVMTRDIEVAMRGPLLTGEFTFTPKAGIETISLADIVSSLELQKATHTDIANAIRDLDRAGALPAEVVQE